MMVVQPTMAELLRAPTEGYAEGIVVPNITADHFELKHSLINLVTTKQFYGFEEEDHHSHIRYFNKITSTLKYKDVPESAIKLMLFPFSVDGPARTWLDKEPARSFLTWDDLVSKSINHFFSPSKTTNLRNEMMKFQQHSDESFYEAWDRFKDLLRVCPHHGFTELHQLDTFYNGLYPSDQDSLNSSAGGNLLERMKATNVNSSEIASAVASAVTSAMAAMLKPLQVTPPLASVKAVEESCVTCGGAHSYRQCPATDGNTFSGYQDNTQGYGSASAVNYNAGNEMLRQFMIASEAKFQLLSNQMSKMEKSFNERPQGALPSNTIPNPREDLKVITTWSGVTLAGPSVPNPSSKEVERRQETITDQVHISSSESTARVPSPVIQPAPVSDPKEIPEKNPIQPLIPYPSRLNKEKLQDKSDIQIYKFLQMFKKLHFNISFAEALAQMPKYAKMLKDLLTNKEKLLELANTSLNENCSAVILKKLPEKLRDTGKFLIPCEFHRLESCMALADLGASINLMPLYVWKTLSLPELSTTRMKLELATQSIAIPDGIAEDVFVQVGKFTFPAEFVVVNYEVDPRVPFILGRPFLRTAHALVDVHGEKLTLRVGNKELVFNVESTSKHPQTRREESINQIDILDTTWEDHFHEVLNSTNPMSGSTTPSSDVSL
ncbi:reverse transcriptase domain-containing protein, partial [Tanacetum coccineum]